MNKFMRLILKVIFTVIAGLMLFQTHSAIGQAYLPPQGKTLLVIGQDLKSVYDYKNSGYFSEPGGITTYINLYDVTSGSAYFPYGALGEDVTGSVVPDVDWGAGPLNARNAAVGYPKSTLSIGLYMTEDYFPGGLSNIANGTYDAQINRLATFLKKIDKPVFLRIGYEFDGNWNTGYANKTNFKNAYKRIVDIIRPVAPKTMMVLQACTSPVDDIIEGYHENIEDWYPGDNYVDYLGYSWFLNTPLQFSLTDEVLALARNHSKPVMVCESSPQGYDLKNLTYRYINTMLGGAPGTNPVSKTPDQIWNEWFQPFFKYIHDNSDVIKVVSYINANWDAQAQWAPPYTQGYWGDSRVEVNATIRQKWITETNSSSWLHGSDQLFSILEGNSTGNENKAPVVSFLNPTSTVLNEGENLYVKVSATDDDVITSVKLYLNGALLREDKVAPYEWGGSATTDPSLFNLTAGTYVLTAEASDQNSHTTSVTYTVTATKKGTPPVSGNFAPADGKTLLMIGQTFTKEYTDYVTAMGKAPAGSSHYAELYTGKINQGDDAANEAFLNFIQTNYPKAYTQLAISIKDNPAAGGYTGANAVWKACKDVVTGKWDTQIDQIAASIKKHPTLKFLVRIDYEVSLNMFANKTETEFIDILNKYTKQGINPLEKADQIEEFDLNAYKNAYIYIAKRIREHNEVSNAAFIFHPVRGFNDAKFLYPGDAYTDWFGLSMFNHDVCWPTWEGENPPFRNCPETQAMDNNIKSCLDWAKTVIKKPIIISESAAQSELAHQGTAAHMNGYLDKIFNIINTYDVKAFVYINSNWVGHNWSAQWGDSRVEKLPAILQHWKDEVLKPRYIHYEDETPSTCPTIGYTSSAAVASGTDWKVTVNASDNSKITKVVFKENGSVLFEDLQAPFEYNYVKPSVGAHYIDINTVANEASCSKTSNIGFNVTNTSSVTCTKNEADYDLLLTPQTGPTALNVKFDSKVSSTFVDVYLSVNGREERGTRLTKNGNSWTITLDKDISNNQAFVNGDQLKFNFIYQKTSAGQVKTADYNFSIGSICASPAIDTDGDGINDEADGCPNDKNKVQPGLCGCGKTEQSCLDCAGTPNGTAFTDECGKCVGGTTGFEACITTSITSKSSGLTLVYPNPFDKSLSVETEGEANVEIYTMTGSKVHEEVIMDNKQIQLDLNAGMYMLKVVKKDKTTVQMIIKK